MCLVNKLYHRYVSIEKNIACIYTYIYKHIYICIYTLYIYVYIYIYDRNNTNINHIAIIIINNLDHFLDLIFSKAISFPLIYKLVVQNLIT